MCRFAAASLVVAAWLVSGGAAASASFPEAMKADLGISAAPACDLCHHGATDPVGTADTLFAKSMVARGLVADDVASLAEALKRMRADGVDSDGDGAQDLDELWWGGDPNVGDTPEMGYQTPVQFGCSTAPGPAGGLPVAVSLGLLGWGARRRRRHRMHGAAVVRE
jgi:MYXO-CTERM domain-containing protein